jgi:hypothetical protein
MTRFASSPRRAPALLLLPILALTGCPSSDDAAPGAEADAAVDPPTDASAPPDASAAPTATGIISIQDQVIHGVPEAGHGLSVRADFTAPGRAPDFDEMPGELTGCKAWLYDLDESPPPAVAGDEGTVTVAGTSAAVPDGCVFDGASAYECPVASGTGAPASVTPMDAPAALYDIAGAAFSQDDVGRHLRVSGDGEHPANAGAFAILAVPASTSAVVANGGASAAEFAADYTVLAGGGAPGVPLDSPLDPLRDTDEVVIGIEPGGERDLDFADTAPIDVGDAFTLDAASDPVIGAIPVDGSPFSIGCSGEGGSCGQAFVSIIQLETTDGDTTGAPPFALPPSVDRKVIITCATPGESGRVDVPAGAAELLRAADQATPITRIRVAFMRDGFQLATNPPPLPPSSVRIVAGHQIVGFTDPPPGRADRRPKPTGKPAPEPGGTGRPVEPTR